MSRSFIFLIILNCIFYFGCQPRENTSTIRSKEIVFQRTGKKISGQSYKVKKTTSEINIDGRLTENGWLASDILSGFKLTKDAAPAKSQTHVSVVYDDQALYFGFVMEDDKSPDLHAMKNNSNVWEDDRIEIFIDPDPSDPAYLQFAANGFARKMEGNIGNIEYDDSYQDWNPPWKAGVVREKGRWILEVRIPFDSIGSNPKPQAVWKLNICRQQTLNGQPVYSVWNVKYGGFHYCGNDLIFE